MRKIVITYAATVIECDFFEPWLCFVLRDRVLSLVLIECFVNNDEKEKCDSETKISLCHLLHGSQPPTNQRWKAEPRCWCWWHGAHINIHHPEVADSTQSIFYDEGDLLQRSSSGGGGGGGGGRGLRIYVYSGVRYNKLGLARLDLPFHNSIR